MSGGYVLQFSDRTFAEFFADTAEIDVNAPHVSVNGTSKANRLRTLWASEPNHVVGTFLKRMIELEGTHIRYDDVSEALRGQARAIADRLLQSGMIEDAAALTPNNSDRVFDVLAREIKQAIERDTPEIALDRLHTFAIKYIRAVYERHFGKTANRDTTANSLLGEYANDLKTKGLIDSKMAAEILKSCGRVLDTFNYVRNNQTLAHDNPDLIKRSEARFIFGSIASSIRFIRSLEEEIVGQSAPKVDIPF